MRVRSHLRTYHLAGRIWLTAALLSLALPSGARLVAWLPLHLVLAGAVSVTISGAMQTFAASLTAAPAPRAPVVWTQFACVNTGALLVAIGYSTHHPALVVAGAVSFLSAIALLGWIVARAWQRGLNHRHPVPMLCYGAAITAILAGGTIGAFVGAGAVHDAGLWVALRQAHMATNVLGWASLTITGTMITLLPTVLRVRMPAARAAVTAALVAAGVATTASGLALRSAPIAAAGSVAIMSGALALAVIAVKTTQMPRNHFVGISAKHLMAAVAWFVAGTVAFAGAMVSAAVRGPTGSDPASVEAFIAFRPTFLAAFVGGWMVQALLGAWLYMLPAGIPGGPEKRRVLLASVEHGGTFELLALNGGLALVFLSGSGLPTATTGTAIAIAGGAVALTKVWSYPLLARLGSTRRLSARLWGM